MDADQTDNRGDAIAVEAQVVESLVLDGKAGSAGGLRGGFFLFNVHGGAVGEFVEQSGGDGEPSLGIGQGEQDSVVGGLALLGAVKSVKPDVKFLTAVGQTQRGIVSDVIAGAHEGVDGAQRFALAARQGEKRIVEVLGRRAGDAPAYRIGHDELGRSGGPGTGNLLRARAHGFPPSFRPTVPMSFLVAARATSESLRGFEMDGRFPRTA